MAGFTTSFGARDPGAQGPNGRYGAVSPGTNASPQTSLGVPGMNRTSTAQRRESTEAEHADANNPHNPPSVQSPSVNRDGTIPPPSAPIATSGATNQANPPGYQDIDYWAQQGIGYGQIFDTNTGQLKPGWRRTDKGYERNAPVSMTGGGGGQGGGQGGGGGTQMPEIGPMADPMWSSFIQANLAPKPLDQTDLPLYTAATTPHFTNPIDPRVSGASNDLMLKILQNPESMPPDIVAMMKESQKESSLSMMDQLMGANNQGAAGRGLQGSGYATAQNFDAKDQAIANITKGYRDIDTTAATTNFQNRLDAGARGDAYMGNQMNMGLGAFGANQSADQFNADQNYLAHGSLKDRVQHNYDTTLDEANLQNQAVGNALQGWSTDIQGNLGRYGVMLDALGLDHNMLMSKLGYGLDLAKFGADQQNINIDRATGVRRG